jgi:MFS family permease
LKQQTGFTSVLWSSCLAMLAVGANGTAIMAALPTMRTELFLSSAGVQWAVNAYLVVSAACIVLGGQAADRFGARLASMVGLALFGVASCIIAAAGTQTELLAGRALQGLAAALAVPGTLAAVDTSAAPERRGSAIGAWTGFLMLGFSIGPLLGGVLTHVTGWRVIFWLNVLLMLAAIAGLATAGSATTRADGTQGWRADWTGFVLLATFMVSLVFGLHALPHVGAAPLPVVGPFVLAAAAFVLLLIVESRAEAPLVDLSFFARRGFVMGVAIGSLSMFSIMSLLLYFNLYAQSREGLGLTALEAGASLLPLSAALLALAPVSFRRGGTGRAAQCHDGWHGADRDRQRRHWHGCRRGRDGPPGDRSFRDGLRSGPALCLGTPAGAVGSFARTIRSGFGRRQRLHLSWRQRRRCRRRDRLRARGVRRCADDDCARRHYRRRPQPRDFRDGIGGGISSLVCGTLLARADEVIERGGQLFEPGLIDSPRRGRRRLLLRSAKSVAARLQ